MHVGAAGGEEGLAEGAGGETEDDGGPASCSQEVPRRSRAAWLCTLSPIGLWGAHAEEMRSILKKCAGRSRDDWIGKKMCQQSACVSATDFFVFKSMFPSESLDLQSWPWLVVCQGAWEHTFRNMFRSICQVVFFPKSNQRHKQYYRLTPQ